MLAKTGLLVVSNPKHIAKLLSDAQKAVKNTLYVQLLSALNDPLGSIHPNMFTTPKLSRTVFCIYSQATKQCNNLDVRVLLSSFKHNISQIHTQNPIDIIIFDKKYTKADIESFISTKISNVSNDHNTLTIECEDSEETESTSSDTDSNVYNHVVLGGTFDRLHTAHKLLLSDAILRASKKVTVGITEENMIHGKLLWELIQNVNTRVNNVFNFVSDICPELHYDICKISDPFGPAIIDPTMDLIMVSEETIRGAEKINELRREKQLKELKIIPIPYIEEPNPDPKEETKVSSSNLRLRLLGTLLNPIVQKEIPKRPYVIGLTGGIASGKSGVASHLENLNVPVINCDKIGHKLYEKGQPCYDPVVNNFGSQILSPEGEIDRRILGGLVFKNTDQLNKLNEIMWPAIAKEVRHKINESGEAVVCVEAAILCLAGWDKFCHEVWTTIVPPNEAIDRLVKRNNLTEDQAKLRIEAQPTNSEYINNTNVVFSPQWEVEYTKVQVHRAWNLLQPRLAL
ncbi:bifunctional coenzyme A synthase-like [Sitophilus oryzae]|uniref:Bifunctional coenzyme A synthase n=1 Tax=Sitophilus oryzae TaxID=7048 RepID=A0A6J2XKX3_SITOR|nr:bifunctional coenzyme A synthase-like [Sitophilus oryzae]